jgi:uncharacterized protein YbbC (DUF1343 family)
MKTAHLAALALAAILSACAGPVQRPGSPSGTLSGLDVLVRDGFRPLRGKRVGVISNRTGVDRRGRSIVDLLADAPGVELTAIFSPEHGFAASSEIENIASGRTKVRGKEIPRYSLYSGGISGMRPKPEQLQGLDVLVFDIQDIGARFYTYLATMAMALEEAKTAGIDFIVLDRPNPIRGDIVEGPVTDDPTLVKHSPVAYLLVATRHGMTAGEVALFHNATAGHPRLTVVKMRGWKRSMWFDETGLPWIAPSPNMPDLAAATLYPGTANLEFTNLSVGRGTPTPFGWIGAPWLDAEALATTMNASLIEGVEFSTLTYTPTKSVFSGEVCRGLRMTVTDRNTVRPLVLFAHLAIALRDLHPKEFDLKWVGSRKLIGLRVFQDLYERGGTAADLRHHFDAGASDFQRIREPFLIYGD